MGSLSLDTLARLRVIRDSGQRVPADLLDDAISCLEQSLDADVVRDRRDALIRRAALLLPANTPYRQAQILATEAAAMERTWRVLRGTVPDEPFGTTRDCLHAARLLTVLPASQRQFYRVLQAANAADMEGAGDVSGSAANIIA